MDFLTSLNLNKNELLNAVVQLLGTPPQNPTKGQIYYDTTTDLIKVYTGTAWVPIGAVVSVAGKTGIVTLVKGDVGLGNVDNTSDATKKTNFTGAIADGNDGFVTGDEIFDALALKLSLTGGTMTGAIAMGSNKITDLATPTSNNDAATKKYVDDLLSGLGGVLHFKGTKASTSALPLSGNVKGDVWVVTEDNSEYIWTSDSASGTLSDYEKLGPTIDLSGYVQKSGDTMSGNLAMGGNKVTGLGAATSDGDAVRYEQLTGLIKTATGTIATTATSCEVSYTGTLINAYAKMNNEIVALDIEIAASKVTFSTAAAPSAAVTCVVIYS